MLRNLWSGSWTARAATLLGFAIAAALLGTHGLSLLPGLLHILIVLGEPSLSSSAA